MEARVVNNLPPAAAHDGAVRCLLAIELSKKSWVAAVNAPLSDKISLHKLKPCDWKELLQLIERNPEANCARIQEARGSDLMLRSWL
jgi:transposase